MPRVARPVPYESRNSTNKTAQSKKVEQDERRVREEEAARSERASILIDRLRPRLPGEVNVGAWEKPGLRKDLPIGFCWPAHTWGYTMVDVVRTLLKAECDRIGVNWTTMRKPEFMKTDRRLAYIEGYKLWFQSAKAEDGSSDELVRMHELTRDSHGRTSKTLPYGGMTPAAVSESARVAYGTWTELTKKHEAAKIIAATTTPARPSSSSSRGGSSSSAVVPPTAAQVVAPAVAAARASGAGAPLKPLPAANRYAVMERFLVDPTQWHTFEPAPPSSRDAVAECMDNNHMFAVSTLSPQTGMPVFRKLDSTCNINGPDDYEFGNFLHDHGFAELLKSQPSRNDPTNREHWPSNFAKLNLEFVGKGTYNSVWAPKAGGSYEDSYFPCEVTDALDEQKTVLRAQIPRDDNRDLLTYDDALTQMTYMADAATGGYGPLIFGMGWQRVTTRGAVDGYRLFTFLERGSMDVDARVSRISREWNRGALHHYMNKLLIAVWGYSSQCFVFVDAKLQNFIDTYQKTPIKLESTVGGSIRVIDLDALGFRSLRLKPHGAGGEGQGWRLTWLHNVLVISCLLRLHMPYDFYRECWWNKVQNAILQMRVELRNPRSYKDDPEYTHVASFINACTWCDPPPPRVTAHFSRLPPRARLTRGRCSSGTDRCGPAD